MDGTNDLIHNLRTNFSHTTFLDAGIIVMQLTFGDVLHKIKIKFRIYDLSTIYYARTG